MTQYRQKAKVTLSGEGYLARGVIMVRCCNYHANGLWFDSRLADFRFLFFFVFFQALLKCYL